MKVTKTGKVFITFDLSTSRPIYKAIDMSLIEDRIIGALSKAIENINGQVKLSDNKNVTVKTVENNPPFYTFAPIYEDEDTDE